MKLDIHVVAEVVTLEIREVDDCVLLEIAERSHCLDLVGAGSHRHGMIVSESVACNQTFLPINHWEVVWIKPVVLTILGNVFLIIQYRRSVIDLCLVLEKHVLLYRHIFRHHGRILPADITTVGNSRTSFFTTFGRDKDHTIGRTRTIDRR